MALLRAVLSRLLDEPVLLSMVATVVVTLAARAGFDLTAEQVAGVLVAAGSVFGLVARSQVTPDRKAAPGA